MDHLCRQHVWRRSAAAGAPRGIAILLFLAFLATLLSSCTLFFKKSTIRGSSPEALYGRGYEDYQRGRYKAAIESFRRLKEQYPLSELAILAELGIADAYFSDGQYGEAEMSYSDFVNLHPTNENLPYAIYQLGMCHYKQMDSIDRDQTETIKAKQNFETLLARFPNSRFAVMAEKMLLECKRRLAERELYVGEFYLKNEKYKAALSRFETVRQNYPNCGFDYQVVFLIEETKRRLAAQEDEDKKGKIEAATDSAPLP